MDLEKSKEFISDLIAETDSSDELAHYGVLGMKWGIRKAERKGQTYTYKSHGQKKWEKKLAKRQKKGSKASKIEDAQDKLELFKTRDQNRQEYARKANLGKSFIKQITMGPIGAGTYSRFRAADNGRALAFLKSNIIVSSLGAPISILASRGSEFKQAKTINKARRRD